MLNNLPIIKAYKLIYRCDDVSLNSNYCMQNAFQYFLHHVSEHDHSMKNAPNVSATYFKSTLCKLSYCLCKCKQTNKFSRMNLGRTQGIDIKA